MAFVVSGLESLKEVLVKIPEAVRLRDTVTLQCNYDLEGETLYTVKWYKGSNEFYRFIPKEHPNSKVFPRPGINVDVSVPFAFSDNNFKIPHANYLYLLNGYIFCLKLDVIRLKLMLSQATHYSTSGQQML